MFVQFLWPFQSYSDSKGRHSPFGIDFEALENDDPVSAFNPHDLTQANENVTVLGEGSRESVKFEWMITPWTECSQSCGPDFGYQVSILLHSHENNHRPIDRDDPTQMNRFNLFR